jgi:hypothetical protein
VPLEPLLPLDPLCPLVPLVPLDPLVPLFAGNGDEATAITYPHVGDVKVMIAVLLLTNSIFSGII